MQPPPAPRRKPALASNHGNSNVFIAALEPLCLTSQQGVPGSSRPELCVHVSCTGSTTPDLRSHDIHVTVLGPHGYVLQQGDPPVTSLTAADAVR
jgi:hypothetical protein